MALPSSLVWEVRTTGSDLNGGAFDASLRVTGTDYSQQDAAQAVYSDLSINATDATKVTSVARPFQATDVGNTIRVPSGISGFTVGVYVIQTVSGGVAGLDRACGTTGTTQGSGSIRLGGAIATLSRLASDMVAKNLAFVKSGNYSETGTVTFTQGAATPNPGVPPSRVIGYSSVRSDYDTLGLSRPTITIGGMGDGLVFNAGGWSIQNLVVAGGGTVGTTIRTTGGDSVNILNCKVTGFTSMGIAMRYRSQAHLCEVTGATASVGIYVANSGMVSRCYVHDVNLSQYGIQSVQGVTLIRNLVANLTGPAHGLGGSADGSKGFLFNTIHNIGGSGVYLWGNPDPTGLLVQGNILTKCGRYGVEMDMAGLARSHSLANNAYGGGVVANALGSRYNADDGGSVNAIDGYLTYRYTGDMTTAGDPYMNAGSGDFRLNAAAGAALKGMGPFNTWPTVTVSGGLDFGAVQSSGAVTQSVGSATNHGFYYF